MYKVRGSPIKFTYKRREFILIVVRMRMNYLSPIENENLFSSEHYTHFILYSELLIFIRNDRNRLILDNYRNEVIRISLYSSHFYKESSLFFKASNLFQKYSYHILVKKVVLEERKNGRDGKQIKG